MSENLLMGQNDVWLSYVTGERVRTHHLPVGRYYDLPGLYIRLIYGQAYLCTVLDSLIESDWITRYFIITCERV